MIKAAGILFKAGDRVLLVKRSAGSDHAGTWSIPAGHIEEGESAEEAAARECEEELGVDAHSLGAVVPWTRSQNDGVDFTSFIVRTGRKFKVKINDESEDYDWAKIGALPQPLHPGVQLLVDRLTMNELDIARVMSEGKLVSPQRYENILLVAMRITGTGVAFRKQLGEYVYRDPKITLTDEFLARCNGLPVIVEHPEKNSLDSKEFQDRIVGTTFLPYINADDVWGIVKIYDDATARMIEDNVLSTSPAVVFRDQSVNETQKLENGATLLIEGKPSLLDHLAIVPLGVWDKGGEPSGVDSVGISRSDSAAIEFPDKTSLSFKLSSVYASLLLANMKLANYVRR